LGRAHLATGFEVVGALSDGYAARLHGGSRMSGDVHVRFRGSLGVRFPGLLTSPPASTSAPWRWRAGCFRRRRHVRARRAQRRFAPDAHNTLGVALARVGRVPEAIAELRRAPEERPDFANARLNLASALLRSEQIGEALAKYPQVRNRSPKTVAPGRRSRRRPANRGTRQLPGAPVDEPFNLQSGSRSQCPCPELTLALSPLLPRCHRLAVRNPAGLGANPPVVM